jgi:hypothetical protein
VFFDTLKGSELVIVINGVCSRLVYCKVLLRSLLVLTVLVLAYVLVGVAPVLALVTTLNIAVARGTNNGVYAASYNSPGVWSSWQSLGGSTPSPPGICDAEGFGVVYLVVRGMDNGIYVNGWTGGSGWAGWSSPPGGGKTIDQPACAYLDGFLHVVVRGMNNELYWNSWAGLWTGWVDLHGKSASAPVLVSTTPDRIDLVVQGMDNGIYHKTYTGSPPSGTWSSWNSPGGATSSRPAAAFWMQIDCLSGCVEYDVLHLVVRGTDNNVYSNSFLIDGINPHWGTWLSLKGKTGSAPTVASYANGCTSSSTMDCHWIDELAVRGTDNAVYHATLYYGWSGWDSPGGSISNSPALAYVPGMLPNQFLLLVEGSSPSHNLYSNTVTASGSTWSTYSSVGGATISDPALVAVL